MKHYGDICGISGYEVPIVDLVVGGSPCQDLSVAGRRAGLKHGDLGDEETTRSGLFMEQIRIIKEMRERERAAGRPVQLIRPRWLLWENVVGALSSPGKGHNGEDFAAVLEEVIKAAEPGTVLSLSVPDGGWPNAGCIYSEAGSWSVAWRVHDAQFWGVAQRRRRLALLADFNGLGAPALLFDYEYRGEAAGTESYETKPDPRTKSRSKVRSVGESLPGDSEPGGEAGEGTPAGTESSADSAICLQGNGIGRKLENGCAGRGWRRDASYTLNTIDIPAVVDTSVAAAGFSFGQSAKARSLGYEEEVSPTIRGGEGGNQKPHVLIRETEGIHSISFQERAGKPGGGKGILIQDEHTGALSTLNIQHVFSIQGNTIDRNAKQNGLGISEDVAHTLDSVDRHGVAITEAINDES